MQGSATGSSRRKFLYHSAAWMGFGSLTLSTFILFCATGGPVPTAFHSWAELGVRPIWGSDNRQSIPCFACISRCGRYLATFKERLTIESPPWEIVIRDRSDSSVLCVIPNKYGFPNSLLVSEDRNLIALQNSTSFTSPGLLFNRSTGQSGDPLYLSTHGMAFSSDNRRMVYTSEGTAFLMSIDQPSARKRMETRGGFRPLVAFFDTDGQAKALFWHKESANGILELWDMQTDQKAWRLEGINEYVEPAEFSPEVFAARMNGEENSLGLFSMKDARKRKIFLGVENVRSQAGVAPYHSPDGRFLFCPDHRAGLLSRWIPPGKYLWLADKLYALQSAIPGLGQSITWTLIDLQSDSPGVVLQVTRPQNQEARMQQAASFHQDGKSMTTIGDDGLYDWDLPPRMRWFTPWAWVALGVTSALGWFLWRSRRRNQSLQVADAGRTAFREAAAGV